MLNTEDLDKSREEAKLSETIENYLSLLYVFDRDKEPVVGTRLAELLGVSPPTVTNTLKRMMRDGLITMDQNGTHLVEQGWQSACTVMRRHMLVEWMMYRLLPWSKLHVEAHSLEHAISATVESALMEEFHHPKTCPHGNPLPGNEDAVATWVPLTKIPVGQTVIIRRIHDLAEENAPLMAFLEEKGIMPGKLATITEILTFNQTITLTAETSPVVLGFTVAKYIFAENG